MSKRTVVLFAVLALMGLAAVGVIGVLVADDERRTGAISSYGGVTGWAFILDGVQIGGLQSVTGCRPRGEVVGVKQTTQTGAAEIDKHLSTVKYEPCVLRMGLSDQQVVYQWINAMLNGQSQPKNLVLTEISSSTGKAVAKVDLSDALLTSVRFPTFDAASTERFALELTVDPEQLTRTEYGTSGPSASGTPAPLPPPVSQFSIELSGITASQYVAKVEGFTAKRQVVEMTGEQRTYTTASLGELVVGDTEVTLALGQAADFNSWFHQFVIQGNNSNADERTGTLKLWNSTRQNVLLTIQLGGVGIFDARTITSGEQQRRTYSLYLQTATLVLPAAASPPPPSPPATTTSPPPPPPPTTSPPPPPPPATTTTTKTETRALAPPVELRAFLGSASEAELAWGPSTDEVEGYVVLYSTQPGGPYTEILRTKETRALVGNLEGGPPYYFVVRAFLGEAESPDSPEAEATG